VANTYFQFKQFRIEQARSAMKVTTDACLFGAWLADCLKDRSGQALDIGTGTGLLSLMLAQKSAMMIEAVEIEEEAASEARENIQNSPFSKRIRVELGNILADNIFSKKKYDVVFSNPPFYENDLKSPNSTRNLAWHQQSLPLDALLQQIKQRMQPQGEFFLLLPARSWQRLQSRLAIQNLQLTELIRIRQTPKHTAFRLLLRGQQFKEPGNPLVEKEWLIRDEFNQYSPEFSSLLKDYYLAL
jgi:tRNA1Val (adenine37-N6)-methyltransferase